MGPRIGGPELVGRANLSSEALLHRNNGIFPTCTYQNAIHSEGDTASPLRSKFHDVLGVSGDPVVHEHFEGLEGGIIGITPSPTSWDSVSHADLGFGLCTT